MSGGDLLGIDIGTRLQAAIGPNRMERLRAFADSIRAGREISPQQSDRLGVLAEEWRSAMHSSLDALDTAARREIQLILEREGASLGGGWSDRKSVV